MQPDIPKFTASGKMKFGSRLIFHFFYDINIKVIGCERENNEFASLREDWSSAVSQSAMCRLVRPGAAMETWPDTLRYKGFKCTPLV
jgi:hypothetical protein